MKIVVIGDIHGRNIWKKIVQKEGFNYIVFIGDYFDSFDISAKTQIENFRDIMAYKKKSKKVTCLIGNHDYHYIYTHQRYSGFQPFYSFTIQKILQENIDNLQMSHFIHDYLFTHAGVSKEWCKRYDISTDNIFDLNRNIQDQFKYKPNSFEHNGYEEYGDHVTSSPIWIRPNSLISNYVDYIQIVGHTNDFIRSYKDKIYFIDSLPQYLVIEDDLFYYKTI